MGATNPQLELFVRTVEPFFDALIPSTAALFSVTAAANLIAMPLWGRYGDARGHGPALQRCAAWCAVALVLHGLAPGYEVLLLARAFLGAVVAGSGPLAFGVAAAESSNDRRGGAFGVIFSARAFSIALAAVAGGWISGLVGIRGLFYVAAFTLAAALWGLRGAPVDQGRSHARRGR